MSLVKFIRIEEKISIMFLAPLLGGHVLTLFKHVRTHWISSIVFRLVVADCHQSSPVEISEVFEDLILVDNILYFIVNLVLILTEERLS